MNKCTLFKLDFDSNNQNLPIFNAIELTIGKNDDNETARTLIAEGGTITLPDGMSMQGNLLPLSETPYTAIISNIGSVTNIELGYNITDITTAKLSDAVSLTRLYLKGLNQEGDYHPIVTGNASLLPSSITWLRSGRTEWDADTSFEDFGNITSLEHIGVIIPNANNGEILRFVTKQILLGRTDTSHLNEDKGIQLYYCQNLKFNGSLIGNGAFYLYWVNISSNTYNVTFNNSTITIQVNIDGSYIVVS